MMLALNGSPRCGGPPSATADKKGRPRPISFALAANEGHGERLGNVASCPQSRDCLAGHVGLEVRRETGKE